jgi:hypothetical protein
MVKLTAHIEGVGVLGPGLDGWTDSVAVLQGRSPYVRQPAAIPVPEGLPPAERRRLGLVVKLALSVGLQATSRAGVEPDALPAVFASSGGDGQNCHEICQALADDEKLISPTRFHNSVHNAAAGYWSIATRSKAASNALCAFDWTFAAGLLEAVTQVVVDKTRVLLVAYDAPYPQPLFAKRSIPEAFGVAFVLAPSHGGASSPVGATAAIGHLTLQLTDAPADRMSNPDLEALRASIPAARALPLLQRLATGRAGVVNIDYLDGRSLAVDVVPCS